MVSKRILVSVGAGIIIISSIVGWALFRAGPTSNIPQVVVYKSPACGCCNKWIDHLKANGFEVTAHNRSDMTAIKNQFGIEPAYQSCHTALVDGYVIEGHVPARDIKRLLKQKPDIKGVTVPGMPLGSPGMEARTSEAYQVLTIDKSGNARVFASY